MGVQGWGVGLPPAVGCWQEPRTVHTSFDTPFLQIPETTPHPSRTLEVHFLAGCTVLLPP